MNKNPLLIVIVSATRPLNKEAI